MFSIPAANETERHVSARSIKSKRQVRSNWREWGSKLAEVPFSMRKMTVTAKARALAGVGAQQFAHLGETLNRHGLSLGARSLNSLSALMVWTKEDRREEICPGFLFHDH